MQKYEITYFTAPDEKTNVVETALKDLGGKILENNNIGIRELAYEVEGLKEALFTSVIFEIESDKLKDLEKKLNQDKKIIRFILIKALRQTEKIEEKEDLAKPKEVKNDKAKIEEKEEEAPAPIAKTPSELKEKPTVAIKPKAKKPSKKIVKKQQEEMPDEELDKKLKELVED